MKNRFYHLFYLKTRMYILLLLIFIFIINSEHHHDCNDNTTNHGEVTKKSE